MVAWLEQSSSTSQSRSAVKELLAERPVVKLLATDLDAQRLLAD
jgi:hypothetical protein